MTCALLASEISHRGSLTSGEHFPSRLAAYFAGAGLVSQNMARCTGIKASCTWLYTEWAC